jgi:hypothetical protein
MRVILSQEVEDGTLTSILSLVRERRLPSEYVRTLQI